MVWPSSLNIAFTCSYVYSVYVLFYLLSANECVYIGFVVWVFFNKIRTCEYTDFCEHDFTLPFL